MAVDLYSDPRDVSPRISFSHDLAVSGIIPVEQAPFRSNSPGSNLIFDFDFDSGGFDRPGSSSADELFSDGKMIPLFEIKKHVHRDVSRVPLPLSKKKGRTEEAEKETGENCGNRNKSFWGFRSSNSLNRGGSHGRMMGLCPLPLLSQSNSTGSVPTTSMNKHSPPRKPFHPRLLPPGDNVGCQNPPMRKPGNIRISRNTVRVHPVLNVAPGNLFGLRSVFVRDKRKRK